MIEEHTTQDDGLEPDCIDPNPQPGDDVDYVRCTACDWAGYVTAGAEDCPKCQANGRMQWADDNDQDGAANVSQ